MITEYLFLSPSGEIITNLQDIRRFVEEHYQDRRVCPHCGCYQIPTGQTHRFLFRVYGCVNSICSASFRSFRLWPSWPLWQRRVA
jgi:hypothetical protein